MFMGFGGPPDPLRTLSPSPETTPKGRERSLPAIPNMSRIKTKSKNDHYKYKNTPRRPAPQHKARVWVRQTTGRGAGLTSVSTKLSGPGKLL